MRLSRRAGFTLIEVLVVVGVIMLLVAILTPALARSREQARAVACRSNLKEWAHVIGMYAGEHKDTLPFEERPDPRPGKGARGETEDANGDKVWDPYEDEPRGWICWFDVLDRYFGGDKADEGVKICPSVRRADPYREESYRMNSKLADSAKYRPPDSANLNSFYMPYRKIGSLKRPDVTVLLFDGDLGRGDDADAPPSFKGRWRDTKAPGVQDDVDYRHNRATNILFNDWHVDVVLKDVLRKRSYYNEGIIWQPPDMGPWERAPRTP
jgi:prepilin-type processing-associated H-X9-DG protein